MVMQTVCDTISSFRQLAEDVQTLFGPVAQEAATEVAREYLEAGDKRCCMTWLQVIHALGGSDDQTPLSEPELTEKAFALLI